MACRAEPHFDPCKFFGGRLTTASNGTLDVSNVDHARLLNQVILKYLVQAISLQEQQREQAKNVSIVAQ
jgi:hypothetical protein